MSSADSKEARNLAPSFTDHLIVLILDQQLAAWHVKPPSSPRRLPLEGQNRMQIATPEHLVSAMADLQSRLQSEGISDSMLHLIVDAASRSQFNGSVLAMTYFFQRPWQLHDWTWLQIRLELPMGAELWLDENLIGARLLPWLTAESDELYRTQLRQTMNTELRGYAEQQAKELNSQQQSRVEQQKSFDEERLELERLHAKECGAFDRRLKRLQTKCNEIEEQHALEIAKLEKTNARLRAQNAQFKEELAEKSKPSKSPNIATKKISAPKQTARKVAPRNIDNPLRMVSVAASELATRLNSQAAWPHPKK